MVSRHADRLRMERSSPFAWSTYFVRAAVLGACLLSAMPAAQGQGSASLGNGLSAPAVARGGINTTGRATPLDAVEGNPAGLAGLPLPTLDLSAFGAIARGSFKNAVNPDAKLTGVAAALPYGAFAFPLGHSNWVGSAAFTPDNLMRANWHYNDPPGTLGVTYGYQRQESKIIALRPSLGLARSFGPKLSAGVTLGIDYNQNNLNAPYIFQEQPALKGLKVLLALSTRGYGWNGSAGVQWQPAAHIRTGLAWKSSTTIRSEGTANGSASALFTTLGIAADPAWHYHAEVTNHLPQAFNAGLSWQTRSNLTLLLQGDFTAWGQAFRRLPVTLTQGTNSTINSVVGANYFSDFIPLNWKNQGAFHVGVELPVRETFILRGGYSYATNPVPSSTLTPLTAAIMQNALAAGIGWKYSRWNYDAAYQVQLPSTKTVGVSGLLAGEYNNSSVEVWTQSVTLSARFKF
jgi:long-subunit fatty acid transport protein